MVSEAAVENALERLSTETAVESGMLAFAREQTPYLQYLRTEGFELLTEDERHYLHYLALVIYTAAKAEATAPEFPMLSGESVEGWDEKCWTWLQDSVGKPMRDRLDPLFAHIDQEELLAFAEDSLVDPEPEGGEATMFANGASRELGVVALGVLVGALNEAMG